MTNFALIFPEIFLSISIMFLLILGVFKKNSSKLIQNISLIVLLVTAVIIFNETLYHSSEHNIYSIIKDVEEEIRSLMIVGHNPSMHEFSESFSGQYIEKFSTCGLASFEFDDEWASIYEDSGTLFEFKIPSELR